MDVRALIQLVRHVRLCLQLGYGVTSVTSRHRQARTEDRVTRQLPSAGSLPKLRGWQESEKRLTVHQRLSAVENQSINFLLVFRRDAQLDVR